MKTKASPIQANVLRSDKDLHPSEKRLFTLKEAAHYLGRSDWGMRDLIWSRKIAAVREGRKIYLDIEDLNEYIRRNKSLYS